MYMVIRAATISHNVEDSEDWNAMAAPWNCVWISGGMRMSRSVATMASTASESDEPGVRLNEIVAVGNCPIWLMTRIEGRYSRVATASSGTRVPEDVAT